MTDASLYTRLDAAFAAAGEKPCMVIPGGASINYRQLRSAAARFANTLVSLGVKPGDRVMIQAEKSITFVAVYLATLRCGAVFNPLNTAYTAAELDYFIGDARPQVLIIGTAAKQKIEALVAAKAIPHIQTLDPDGTGSILDLAFQQSDAHTIVPREGQDLAALLYTSGTTGRSKGAMITHENLLSNAETLTRYWGFSSDDVLLHALPVFHVHGLFVALHTALLNGCTMHWLAKFDLELVLALLPQSTVMMGVPTFYTRLLSDKRFGKPQCKAMRLFIAGSAPLLAETHIEFESRSGHKILERYGMTEAGMITSNPYHSGDNGGERRAGTVGYALPGVSVRVASSDGTVLSAGDVGTLEVKGPNVFIGYWQNPEKTKEDFRADGYFITGDLSTLDPGGRVTIVGRAKDLIISGGFNVYPKEIEEEVNALAGVGESAIIGVPHPDFGEAVVAVIAKATGAASPTEAEVIAKLSERLAKFKLPKRVYVLDDLPRNAMGKVQKAELRKTYGATFMPKA
jgi:malonyl-CoA/methylmalonyl-CoA synthetase